MPPVAEPGAGIRIGRRLAIPGPSRRVEPVAGAFAFFDALAERYNDPDFWNRALREGVLGE
jgi:hypothetical protein